MHQFDDAALLEKLRTGDEAAYEALVRTYGGRMLAVARGFLRKPEETIEPMLPTYFDDGHHTEDFSDWGVQADRILEQKQLRAAVRAGIETLPESYRTVLMLRDVEEMTTEEVAEQIGVSANAIKIRLHRARQALCTVLESQFSRNGATAVGIPNR
jgi:RNA polymerase sigma-70 factor (ECF subfamily)